MSKTDVMGLGPFLKALGERLDRMTKEEICRVLVQRGKTIPSVEIKCRMPIADCRMKTGSGGGSWLINEGVRHDR